MAHARRARLRVRERVNETRAGASAFLRMRAGVRVRAHVPPCVGECVRIMHPNAIGWNDERI